VVKQGPSPCFLEQILRHGSACGSSRRKDGLMSEALKLSAVAMSAREKVARLEALLEARRVGHWWRRPLARDAAQTRASRGGNGRSAVLAGVPVRI
jgi:hypothetical protein